jgi:hypothetical protein
VATSRCSLNVCWEKERNVEKTDNVRINVILRRVRFIIFAAEKQEVLHILESVSAALIIQHAKCMGRIILSFVACTAVLYSSTSGINDTNLGKCSLNTKCVLWFSAQLLSQTFLILKRIQRDSITNVHRSSCLVTFILLRYYEIRIFSTDFIKILNYQISWKSLHWEPRCYMRTDGQTWCS